MGISLLHSDSFVLAASPGGIKKNASSTKACPAARHLSQSIPGKRYAWPKYISLWVLIAQFSYFTYKVFHSLYYFCRPAYLFLFLLQSKVLCKVGRLSNFSGKGVINVLVLIISYLFSAKFNNGILKKSYLRTNKVYEDRIFGFKAKIIILIFLAFQFTLFPKCDAASVVWWPNITTAVTPTHFCPNGGPISATFTAGAMGRNNLTPLVFTFELSDQIGSYT